MEVVTLITAFSGKICVPSVNQESPVQIWWQQSLKILDRWKICKHNCRHQQWPYKDQVGAGLVSIKQRKNCKLQLVQIKIPLKLQLVWFLCLELMFGNMLIISNTKMSGPTMSKLCGKSLIGLIYLIDLLRHLDKFTKILFDILPLISGFLK